MTDWTVRMECLIAEEADRDAALEEFAQAVWELHPEACCSSVPGKVAATFQVAAYNLMRAVEHVEDVMWEAWGVVAAVSAMDTLVVEPYVEEAA